MKILKKIPLIICAAAMLVLIAVTGSKTPENKSNKVIKISNNEPEEMRGVWVTYMDLNMNDSDRSFKSFESKFRHIADKAREDNFNTLIVQVRPFCDALYRSKYYPNSHVLSGKQGEYPGYDALKYMCEYTHKIGMKIHAWINPYRVKSNSSLKLSKDNPYKKDKSVGEIVNGGIYLNPALPKVRELIENGVREVVEKYDVDGIQFDDYFYPTEDESFDKSEYNNYKNKYNNPLSLHDWRTTNVNILIAECYSIIHNTKDNVVFGISPQGNISNNYNLCADVRSWCSQHGYIDYICPQLYFSKENPALKFSTALRSWTELEYSSDVKLFVGIAGYKTGTDSDSGTWLDSDTILQEEIKLSRKKGVDGFMFYSFADLETERASKEVSNLINILD